METPTFNCEICGVTYNHPGATHENYHGVVYIRDGKPLFSCQIKNCSEKLKEVDTDVILSHIKKHNYFNEVLEGKKKCSQCDTYLDYEETDVVSGKNHYTLHINAKNLQKERLHNAFDEEYFEHENLQENLVAGAKKFKRGTHDIKTYYSKIIKKKMETVDTEYTQKLKKKMNNSKLVKIEIERQREREIERQRVAENIIKLSTVTPTPSSTTLSNKRKDRDTEDPLGNKRQKKDEENHKDGYNKTKKKYEDRRKKKKKSGKRSGDKKKSGKRSGDKKKSGKRSGDKKKSGKRKKVKSL
jgi:hypothetical protein